MHNCPCSTEYPDHDMGSEDSGSQYYGPHSLDPSMYEFRVTGTDSEWFTPCSAHEGFYHNNSTFDSRRKG